MPSASFTVKARQDPDGVLLVEVPATAVLKLGDKQRPPVRVTLNGVQYRSTVAVYGGRYYLPARKEIREAAKLAAGKHARVTLELDDASRMVTAPARPRSGAHESRREGCVQGDGVHAPARACRLVTGAKRPETRTTRIAKVVADALASSRAPRARGSRSSGRAAGRGS